jgi:carbon monoxide dehydrogenase subunit G
MHFEATLNAPVGVAFEFISKPVNMLALIPPRALLTYQDIWKEPDGNYGYSIVFQFMRIKAETKSWTTEIIPNRKLVIHTEGQVTGNAIWELSPDDEATHIVVIFEYEESEGLIAMITRQFTETVLRDTLNKIAAHLIRLFGVRK